MGMEKSNTREQILEAALDLFAVGGYEATSISQLAGAVGIRKASLYSHFANKQTAEDVAKLIHGQMRYILHDPHISKGRKLLMIEQFRNEELAELQTKQNYEDVLNYFMGMMRFLIREGTLKDADTEIMAAQFSSPITVWINLCDREPKREDEVMDLVRKHVMQFFEIYKA